MMTFLGTVAGLLLCVQAPARPAAGTLEESLRAEGPKALAAEARRAGDARRGAIVFFRPSLTCAKCHDARAGTPPLGPDLTARDRNAPGADPALVESILDPSKVIKPGYETVTIATEDGRVFAGLPGVDTPDAFAIRDPGQDGKAVAIPRADVEQRKVGGASIMPAGLANNLESRAQFLDLVRYLMEIAEGGPDRARALRPDADALARAASPLPEADRDIDHAGLIRDLDADSFKRGEAIYNRVCINCHGTKDRPGSLPTSLRFASGTFKNGSDFLSLYRTLSLGFGQMTPQAWMVPRQKYDVLHYIREAYLKPYNRSQYAEPDAAYLAGLPKGTSRGPEPVEVQPWSSMDYGPSLMATYEVSNGDGSNTVPKGIAVRVDPGPGGVSRGHAWILYDEDTMRFAAAWTGEGFIDWNGINFNGVHAVHPRLVGSIEVANPATPGWAVAGDGGPDGLYAFDDPRPKARDGRRYGPLPPWLVHYRGLHRHGARTILEYSVGRARVLEMPGLERPLSSGAAVFSRTIDMGPPATSTLLRVAPEGTAVELVLPEEDPSRPRPQLETRGGQVVLHVPPAEPRRFKLLLSRGDPAELHHRARLSAPPESLEPLTRGGPSQWPERLAARGEVGRDDGPFAADVLHTPESNPWLCQLRLSGFDFLPGGHAAAVCSWDGDVWLVDGVDRPESGLTWRRIASGLFQPLGLKVRDGAIYVCCRDEIVRLRDLDGDGEADFYENFNNDHQVTTHFHEFAMDLQADDAGNFYYAKAACHGLPATVPQHGTILKVSADGRTTEILATGFRAPNGVCLNPDGTFWLSDQEGFWTPKNRINLVKKGGFYGNMWGYTDVTDPSDSAMEQPLCWITNAFDRSPAQLLWADSKDPKWSPLSRSLLCLSYGYGKAYVVLRETVDGMAQGGECALPLPRFPTGIMRGRFHPDDGGLYTCGLFAWAGDQTQPGGFYRIRATGKPMGLPVALHAKEGRVEVTFTDRLDPVASAESSRVTAKAWSLRRTVHYGSEHHDERPLAIESSRLSADGRTLTLSIPDLRPTMGMEITYRLQSTDGHPISGTIHNTIHRLGR
ncbi:hypothetical protein OJF2_70440 [Aquisphaera giovannonii]|uniref:Cytochrome c domain-containing protein n=1 Tax=Aquisphaera giovannonii TaxID=406548 RepID=A0A5B9WD86_9BACT|nr:DUF6797 domain-containing protein [Aquisphaera giovannonii]QEH38443.1 hypothetical protein OJF2_70440 [Aquisphaera giovannonii]